MSDTSDPVVPPAPPPPPRMIGVLAAFPNGPALIAGVEAARKAGYTRMDAHSPLPVHGLDEALGLKPTHLPWLVFLAGGMGTLTAIALQFGTNAIDYPFRISGKPLFSLPSSVPVAFELTILFAAFATFFGMLLFNRLWQFYHPVLEARLFDRVTNDHFLLGISAADPRFNAETTAGFMRSLSPMVETVLEDTTPARVPRIVWNVLTVLAIVLLIPPLWIVRARATRSDFYPVRLELGMRFQQKVKTQTEVPRDLFADGLAMRPPVAGTVARGQATQDDAFHQGMIDGQYATAFPDRAIEESAASYLMGRGQVAAADPKEALHDLRMRSIARGQERYNIYCSPCHGLSGSGNGPINLRADLLLRTKPEDGSAWVKPSTLAGPGNEAVRVMTDGQIFRTITYGARSMKGYEARIPPADRWAIVLYVRALQKSQSADPADVPVAERAPLEPGR